MLKKSGALGLQRHWKQFKRHGRWPKSASSWLLGFSWPGHHTLSFSFIIAFDLVKDIPTVAEIVPSMFAKTASVYNPIIYFFSYKSFRESLVKSWRRYRNRNNVIPLNSSGTAFVVSSRLTAMGNRAFESTSCHEISL